MGGEEVFAGLEPRALWRHFGALTTIPRPPRNEGRVVAHVRDWAVRRGHEVAQDGAGNLVVRVPATRGRERAPFVVLQGHLDMVCERDPDSPYDAAQGRIRVVRTGEWVTADGTTLGADDGVGIAAMMALGDGGAPPHGPLELLMTVAEEVGLEGADRLEPSLVRGGIMLNLDSEEDGRLTVGCAGSTDVIVRLEGERPPVPEDWSALRVAVSDGLGGHSGANIAEGRANAIKALGRTLRAAARAGPFRLVSLDGGGSRNAIPRAAAALCAVAPEVEATFRRAVESASSAIRAAHARTDPTVRVTVATDAGARDAWTTAWTERVLDVVALIPSGPLALSPEFDDLVETSSSLGVASTDGRCLTLHSLARTSNEPALADVVGAIEAAGRLAGGSVDVRHNHSGWQPNLDSPVLAAARAVYEGLFGEAAVVTAVHAGLETAVLGNKLSGIDMISFGPQIEYPHSPDERVSVPTVERFWRLLSGLLDELSRPSLRN